jgi:peptidoglycan/LPS O-acetylase OafA/YrhL
MKINYLESLRGIASMMIVILHASLFTPYLKNFNFIQNSYLFVDFFFVLSGFVISYKYLYNLKNKNDFIKFIKKRFLRLYPLHFFLLIIYLFFDYFQNYLGYQSEINFNNLYSFFANLTLTHALIPDFGRSFNSVSWSISVEFYTYILFALIIIFISSIRLITFISIALIFLSNFFLLDTGFNFNFSHNQILRCINGFFQGVLIYTFYKKINFSNKYFLYLILFFLLLILSIESLSNLLQISFVIFVSAAIFILLKEQNKIVIALLEHKYLTFLGKISYSTYMSHYIFAVGIKYLLLMINFNINDKLIYQFILLLAYLSIVILFSNITYLLIEKKFYKK